MFLTKPSDADTGAAYGTSLVFICPWQTLGLYAIIQVPSSWSSHEEARMPSQPFWTRIGSTGFVSKLAMHRKDIDQKFLEERLDAISEGLKEGVRREVERLTELGLPIVVADNGHIVDRQTKPRRQK